MSEEFDLTAGPEQASGAEATVSVICPVFESEDFLPDCLRSLLNQSYRDLEVVVVDDCSPGNCREIVEQHGPCGRPIKYVRNETNRGTLYCRFVGARAASGKYIMFIDSDDTAEPHFVEALHGLIARTGADFAGCSRTGNKATEFILEGSQLIFRSLADATIPNWNVWTKIYQRAGLLELDKLIAFSEQNRIICPEDAPINLFYAMRSRSYAHTPEVLVNYNEGRLESTTNAATEEAVLAKVAMRIAIFRLMYNEFREQEEDVNFVVSRLAAHLYRKTLKRARSGDAEKAVNKFLEYENVPYRLPPCCAQPNETAARERAWRETIRNLKSVLQGA